MGYCKQVEAWYTITIADTISSWLFCVLFLHHIYLEPQNYCQALFAKISPEEKENIFYMESWTPTKIIILQHHINS